MDTAVRVLELLGLLQEKRFWTGPELARALGVTARCVRRDVQRLRDLGYPVQASVGVGGGYTLGAGMDLPPLPLDEDEAIACAIGLRAAASGVVRDLQEPALRALGKLEVVLPKALRHRLTAIEASSVSLARPAPPVDAGVLVALAAACRDSVSVELDYEARDGGRSHRRLHPVRLVHSEVRWYLLAWDRVRGDWRTFRLDRVAPGSVRPGERLAPREPPEADVVAYVERQLAHTSYALRVRARVHLPAEEVRRRIGGYGCAEPDGPERCWLVVSGDDPDTIAPWLAMLGCEIDQVEPESVRQALGRLGERLIRGSRPPD